MKQIKEKKIMVWLGLVIMMMVMTVSLIPGLNGQAAVSSNKISLNNTSISVKEGITGKITVKINRQGQKFCGAAKTKRLQR